MTTKKNNPEAKKVTGKAQKKTSKKQPFSKAKKDGVEAQKAASEVQNDAPEEQDGMLTLYLKKKKYQFPNSWEKLTQEQFIYLAGLLRDYHLGILDAGEVRIRYFLMVAGLKPRRIRRAEREQLFTENVYRAASKINFFFKYEYENKKSFHNFPKELQEQLQHTDPEELPASVEVRAARKMKRSREVDVVFARNLVTELPGIHSMKAYRFNMENGFVDTSLTAAQYVDAYSVFESWSEKNEVMKLDLLCAILYQDKDYSSEKAYSRVELARTLSPEIKVAVVLNYMAIHVFFAQRTKYAILFTGTETDKTGKISLGFHNSIYSLIKAGYGDVEKMNLVKFLDLMLKELQDGVQAMHASEMKMEDIAAKSKLSIPQIIALL